MKNVKVFWFSLAAIALLAVVSFAALFLVEANWMGAGEPIPCRQLWLSNLPRLVCEDQVNYPDQILFFRQTIEQ